MVWIGGAGLAHDVVRPIHFVMPRAAMPMIVANEIENTRSSDIQRHVFVFCQLIEEMAGICAFVSAAPVISAAHVCARADALIRPALPLAIGIQPNGNDGRFRCSAKLSKSERSQQKREAQHPLI